MVSDLVETVHSTSPIPSGDLTAAAHALAISLHHDSDLSAELREHSVHFIASRLEIRLTEMGEEEIKNKVRIADELANALYHHKCGPELSGMVARKLLDFTAAPGTIAHDKDAFSLMMTLESASRHGNHQGYAKGYTDETLAYALEVARRPDLDVRSKMRIMKILGELLPNEENKAQESSHLPATILCDIHQELMKSLPVFHAASLIDACDLKQVVQQALRHDQFLYYNHPVIQAYHREKNVGSLIHFHQMLLTDTEMGAKFLRHTNTAGLREAKSDIDSFAAAAQHIRDLCETSKSVHISERSRAALVAEARDTDRLGPQGEKADIAYIVRYASLPPNYVEASQLLHACRDFSNRITDTIAQRES